MDYLLHLTLLPEVEVNDLNNEATRAPSPHLIESIQRGMYAAVETAMDETDWMGCWPNTDTVDCGQQALDLNRVAWRRPIKDPERNGSMVFGDWRTSGFADALTMSLSVLLQSPDLYTL